MSSSTAAPTTTRYTTNGVNERVRNSLSKKWMASSPVTAEVTTPQKNAPGSGRQPSVADELGALVRQRAGGDGEAHQERDARRRIAIEAEEPTHGHRRARAGDAGLQRRGLAQPDQHRFSEAVVRFAFGGHRPVGHQEHEAEHDQHDRHQPWLAQVTLDEGVEGRADHEGGQGRHDEQEREPFLVGGRGPMSKRPQPGGDEGLQVAPEVHEHREERAQVQCDVVGLLQLGVVVELVPREEPGHEDQMTARRDRQELGQPLGQPEHDRVDDGDLRAGGREQHQMLRVEGTMRGRH